MTKWITEKDAKIAAKEGQIPALEMSLKHHQQPLDATKLELIQAIETKVFHLRGTLCACCLFDGLDGGCSNRKTCVLYTDQGCCNDLWQKANSAFQKLQNDYSNANFKAFQDAEAKVCDYIEGVLKKEREKEKVNDGHCLTCKYSELKGNEHPCGDCSFEDKYQPKPKSKESKPKLRHGEMRLWHGDSNMNRPVVIDLSQDEPRIIFISDSWKKPVNSQCPEETILQWSDHVAYAFDLIAEQGRGLEEFKQKKAGFYLEVEFDGDHISILSTTGAKTPLYFTVEELEEIITKLTRVRNKARNKDKKK